jgi:hypothetical protein
VRTATLALGLVLGPMLGTTLAGIVVLKNGGTVVGKIDASAVTSAEIVVRDPEGIAGRQVIPMHEVRWFDADANAPTDAYWQAHLDAAIDARWEPARQVHIINKRPLPGEQDPETEIIEMLRGPLLGQPIDHAGTRLRLPSGWIKPIKDGILMAHAKEPDASGFKPRIHVFSVEAPEEQPSEQLSWIEAELSRVASREGYRTQEAYRLKQVPGGHDQMMVTVTHIADQERDVLALRKICFRQERIYFFAAYADAREFEAHRPVFLAAMQSFTPGP